MLSATRDGVHKSGALTVIVSGDRPFDAIKSSNPRYVGIDGRIADLKSDSDASLFPLISDNWALVSNTEAKANSPLTRNGFKDIVSQTHAKGRRCVRFWATAESEDLWNELRTADVDLLAPIIRKVEQLLESTTMKIPSTGTRVSSSLVKPDRTYACVLAMQTTNLTSL